ncbi:hypothetical protein [Streptomyces nigra]|uniref:hypothetical protein n=1 Tax=Streptomyces nigra TaxID=1827580 RepID=UPI0038008958
MRTSSSCGRSSSPQHTDYARDRGAGGTLLGTAPVLDEARAAHLAQARESVRAYTVAVQSGGASEARQILVAWSARGACAGCRRPDALPRD